MDVVMNDVRLLVKKELAAANKKFPMFASAHEGWAVIREELQEVKDDHYMLEQAALEAGIPAANFPFKTWMYISEKDGIVVRDGYGAPPVRI